MKAVRYGKGISEAAGEVPLAAGRYAIRCPAECRIRVEVPGFHPGLKSIFIDDDRLYRDLFWPIRRERLWDPEFYREIERRLARVVLDFELEAE